MSKRRLRKALVPFFRIIDLVLSPFTLLAAALLWGIRKMGVSDMRVSKWIFLKVGVFPIRDHYYEPLFNEKYLKLPLDRQRPLPGIDWNAREQLELLHSFHYQDELKTIPFEKPEDELTFFYGNPSLGPADAEYLYCMIRHFRPGKIIEIGSGYSTLMAQQAISKTRLEQASYHCGHTCIEPYEMPWLEKTGVEVIRRVVEETDMSLFRSLGRNDILFIDSSHMIRPQGDVLFEFLEILPLLQPGVIIHVHDIFSPGDYTKRHLVDEVLFWNEQYLLEAFLTCNDRFRIIGALNYLKTRYPEEMFSRLPILKMHPAHVPGSFWMVRTEV
jgi:predicted O-methyltransferase YrrM